MVCSSNRSYPLTHSKIFVCSVQPSLTALVSSVVFSYTVTFDSGTNAEQSQEQQRWPKAMDTTTLEELVCFG